MAAPVAADPHQAYYATLSERNLAALWQRAESAHEGEKQAR